MLQRLIHPHLHPFHVYFGQRAASRAVATGHGLFNWQA
jgi:hypothetical protein